MGLEDEVVEIHKNHKMTKLLIREWSGSGILTVFVCSVCKLRHYHARNGLGGYCYDEFHDSKGNRISVKEAASAPCKEKKHVN